MYFDHIKIKVKQAPVPKVYLDAKERIKSWTVDTVPEEEDEETE